MVCDQVIDSYDGSKDITDPLVFPGDYAGQAFTMGGIARDICKAKFYLAAVYAGGNSIDIAAKIYACSGTPGTDGVPIGVALATSNIIQYTGDQAAAWVEFTFDTPYTLIATTNYCIVVECIDIDGTILYIDASIDNTTPSHSGNYCYYSAGDEGYEAGEDLNFYIYYGVNWSGKINGITPGKVNGIHVAFVGQVIGA